ncbi:MAG: fatty acid desaturase [Rhodothermales bacterium]|nr:fatty acid desaturase [Rhodothermales bacterium]
MRAFTPPKPHHWEWPTLAVLAGCYIVYLLVTWTAADLGPVLSLALLSVTLALHSSLQHEVIHGHPFGRTTRDALLVFPPIGLFVPYQRFRDTHLAHHQDANLTDPYDDPETKYMDLLVLRRMPLALQYLFRLNNTLSGRMLVGPVIGFSHFYFNDGKRIIRGDKQVARAYVSHFLGLVIVFFWLANYATMSIGMYILAAYIGMSILKIRTFLEHQANESASGRTAIVDDRGPLAWLFLYNNFHSVHHLHPRLPWYRLPSFFDKHRARLLTRNNHYYYASYGEVFRQYLLWEKDSVAHPLWSISNRTMPIEIPTSKRPETKP